MTHSKTLRRAAMGALATLTLLSTVLPAAAITRIRSDLNSCATVQQTLARDGVAVVKYPSKKIANYLLYDRYVSRNYFCPIGEAPAPRTVPAKDNPQCVVYHCEKIRPLFEFRDLRRPRER